MLYKYKFPANQDYQLLSIRGNSVSVEEIEAGIRQGSILTLTLYSLHICDIPKAPGVYLAFADGTCTLMYATDRKDCYVLRKLQRCLNLIEAWCEHWNIKIYKDTTRADLDQLRLASR
jgi:hypothetical protein